MKKKLNEIEIKIEKSIATLEDSKFLIENNKLEIAANRLYYSIFHILSALAEKYNFETSKHIQLLGWFNKNFIINNKVDKKYGKIAHKLFDLRSKADYDYYTSFNLEQVNDMYNDANSFIKEILYLIKKN